MISRMSTNSQEPVQSAGSRLIHAVDRWASSSTLAVVVIVADTMWLVFSTVVGFPARLESIFQTLVAALTLTMLFVIQHTQATEQAVIERKLDDLLKASRRT
jgi:low affinity Fe/Cu permease